MVAERSGLILLDTCVLLMLAAPEPLPADLKAKLTTAPWAISPLSAWEITIKHALGKLPLPQAPTPWWRGMVTVYSLKVVPFTDAHALRVGSLPAIHGDPFDRGLIATALELGCPLATIDSVFTSYRGCGLQVM